MTAHSATDERRELDARTGDGLHVRLLWNAGTDQISVTVADLATGREFEVQVGDGVRPLDVFRHPFAYAVDDGIAR